MQFPADEPVDDEPAAPVVEASSSDPNEGEWLRTALAGGAFGLLLFSYYILRPVRDQIAVYTGTEHVPWLFTWTFLCTLALVPVFGWVVKRCAPITLVPMVFGTMVACLIGFVLAFSSGITTLSATLFFIWVSVFNMPVISLFWSTVGDAFTTQQAERRYGFIAAGGTVGAIAGPAVTTLLARHVATSHLLLLSMGLLVAATITLMALRTMAVRNGTLSARPIGGSVFAGITQTVQSPLLSSLAGLVICYSTISTVLYLELNHIAGITYSEAGDRTTFFAKIDLGVNLLALTIQLAATQQIIRYCGLRRALLIAPSAMLTALVFIGLWPTAVLYGIVQVLHRASEFSLSKPSREILFTMVDAESRYKAKNFIDTAVYRANDTGSSWLVSWIRGAGGNAVLMVALPVTLLWIMLCRIVAQRHEAHSKNKLAETPRDEQEFAPFSKEFHSEESAQETGAISSTRG